MRRKRYAKGDEWKLTLEPWGRLYGMAYRAMNRHLERLSDEKLAELLNAVEQPSQTNCGWEVYGAAQFIKSEARWVHRTRAKEAVRLGPWRDKQGDVWQLGEDGLMHTPETIPFSREYVEKKWGPLVSVTAGGV